jgi:hypothetical protein
MYVKWQRMHLEYVSLMLGTVRGCTGEQIKHKMGKMLGYTFRYKF